MKALTGFCYQNGCRDCPRRKTCPPGMKALKHARLDKTAKVSQDRMRRAAAALSKGWCSPFDIGCAVMRQSIKVSGNRIVKKMLELGLLVSRPAGRVGGDVLTEYRLSADGEELFGCAAT